MNIWMMTLTFGLSCTKTTKQSEDTAETRVDTTTDTSSVQDTGTNIDTASDIGTGGVSPTQYCDGENPELYSCEPDENYDPWIASTGEVNYWIRDAKTGAIPFLTTYEAAVEYGYLQITSGERVRDRETEDVFHIWFSTEPNGPVLEGVKCEWYATQARGNVYWSWIETYADQVCIIPQSPQILYINFETRCYPGSYEGVCDDDNKQKSEETFQFDIARRLSWL